MGESTKKLLVAFDPRKPIKQSSDFLVPRSANGRVVLWGLRSKAPQEHGLAVFTGRTVGAADLFARLVDSGATIEGFDHQMTLLEQFVTATKSTRIGSVYTLLEADDEKGTFSLDMTPLKASELGRKLP